jgi:hypothetical protein
MFHFDNVSKMAAHLTLLIYFLLHICAISLFESDGDRGGLSGSPRGCGDGAICSISSEVQLETASIRIASLERRVLELEYALALARAACNVSVHQEDGCSNVSHHSDEGGGFASDKPEEGAQAHRHAWAFPLQGNNFFTELQSSEPVSNEGDGWEEQVHVGSGSSTTVAMAYVSWKSRTKFSAAGGAGGGNKGSIHALDVTGNMALVYLTNTSVIYATWWRDGQQFSVKRDLKGCHLLDLGTCDPLA